MRVTITCDIDDTYADDDGITEAGYVAISGALIAAVNADDIRVVPEILGRLLTVKVLASEMDRDPEDVRQVLGVKTIHARVWERPARHTLKVAPTR